MISKNRFAPLVLLCADHRGALETQKPDGDLGDS